MKMRWMAIDHGMRRIGTALCDPTETLVTPRLVFPNEKGKTAGRIAALAREEAVDAVVIGLPRHKDGAESATAGAVREFATELEVALAALDDGAPAGKALRGIPIRFWGESLSTVEAERILARGRTSVSPEVRRRKLDALAAAVILEDLLSSRRSRGISSDSSDV